MIEKPKRKGPGGLPGAVILFVSIMVLTMSISAAWAVGQHLGHAIGGGLIR